MRVAGTGPGVPTARARRHAGREADLRFRAAHYKFRDGPLVLFGIVDPHLHLRAGRTAGQFEPAIADGERTALHLQAVGNVRGRDQPRGRDGFAVGSGDAPAHGDPAVQFDHRARRGAAGCERL